MNTKTSNGFTILLAFLPLMMLYKVPGMGIMLTTLFTFIGMIYSITLLLKRKIEVPFLLILPLILYLLYVMTMNSHITAFIYGSVIMVLLGICTGIVDVPLLRRVLERIAVVSAFCVILQQLVHIVAGVHVPFVIGPLMTDGMHEQYGYLLTTGMTGEGIYRPSAFFHEPASFSQYCIIGLASSLIDSRPKIKRAIIISLGIFACTSGMGFVSVFAIWGVWLLSRQKSKTKIIKRLPFILIFLIIVFYILNKISFTHNIINRFTTTDTTEYNAIDGRLFWWDTFFGDFSFSSFLYGFGPENLPEDVYFTGFMTQLFCYGVIGVSLLLVFLVFLMFKSDLIGLICVVLYTGLLFFANLTYYSNILFYMGAFLAFYVDKGKRIDFNKRIELNKVSINTEVT